LLPWNHCLVGPPGNIVLLNSVSFLNFAYERVVISFDLHQIVIGKLAPFPLQFAFKLSPPTFEGIGEVSAFMKILHFQRVLLLYRSGASQNARSFPGVQRNMPLEENYVQMDLSLGRNDGCLGVDDTEAIPNLFDAQHSFRQPGRFPSRERAHRRSLQGHFTLVDVDDDHAVCRQWTGLHGFRDSGLQLDVARLFGGVLHLQGFARRSPA
jgi:hypothetical protein